MPKVLITDKMSIRATEVFKGHEIDVDVMTGLDTSELIKIIGDYDGLAVRSATYVDNDVLTAAKKLKVIGRAGIGVDNIDIKAASAHGIVVMNTPFSNAITTAEHAIAMLFAAARQIPAASDQTQQGKWPKSDFTGIELSHKTLGLIGCGNIGALVAERALGLKMKVMAYDPYLNEERAVKLGVEKVALDTLVAQADAISLHTPLVKNTRNILSRERLAITKPGVIIINCARGGLIDETALKSGLDSGHIYAAALDVFEKEPATTHPLFGTPHFIATPHLGASTQEAQEKVAVQIAEQISDYLLSGAVQNALNMPAISTEEAPRIKPFINLSDKMGRMMGQLMHEPIEAVEITYKGVICNINTKPVTTAAIAGLLKAVMPEVNFVSAPALASERGIEIKESYIEDADRAESLIRIVVETQSRKFAMVGTIYRDEPRIVRLFGIPMDAGFFENMLYVRNEDTPGFVGLLGQILGEARINIATLSLGRRKAGSEAICLISVDQPVPEQIKQDIAAIQQTKIVDMVCL